MDDRELLRDYVAHRSETAFAELVARHVNLVHATALRLVRDPGAAQDVVQSVFILLAGKAWMVRDANALPGWLYRATCRAALIDLRGERRRRQREHEAMKLAEQNEPSPAAWENLAPLLDEAMRALNRTEQNAVVLRFFENKTLRETGRALAVSQHAAHKRVTRAVEKMRAHFARRGITVASATLATAITANPSQAAPVGLAAKVTTASVAGANVAGKAGLFSSLKLLFHMSTKTNLALAAAALSVVALATYQFQINHQLEANLPSLQRAAARPKPRMNMVARKADNTEPDNTQLSLSVVQPPGVPTILRKIGAKFYPLTVDDLQRDPDLMNQLTERFAAALTPRQANPLKPWFASGPSLLKGALMNPANSLGSLLTLGTMRGEDSADAPKFLYYAGERSGVRYGGGGFGFTMSGPDGIALSKNYVEIRMNSD